MEYLRRRTIRIAGDRIEIVAHNVEPEGVLLRWNGRFVVEGTHLRVSTTCPTPSTQLVPFTVTPDGLQVWDAVGGKDRETYVRR